VLGQQASETKSNEITAIPLLLERLALTGALVTIDAMGTQTRIAQAILDRGGDYLLALKDNQASLHDEVRRYLNDPAAKHHSHFETTDGDHGRIEVRRHLVSHQVDWLTTARRFPGEPRFPGLGAIAMVEAEVERNGSTSLERALLPVLHAPSCSPTPCDAIGMSRTVCTGSSTWCSTRISAACDPAPDRRTWPLSGPNAAYAAVPSVIRRSAFPS